MIDNKPSEVSPLTQPQDANPYLVPTAPPEMPQSEQMLMTTGDVTSDEKTMGMLIHLLAIITGFLGVIILWLVKKDESKFIDFHGREALNFMISITIYGLALSIFTMIIAVITFGIGMFLMIPLVLGFSIWALVYEIRACMAASRGEHYKYPLTLRLIPTVR